MFNSSRSEKLSSVGVIATIVMGFYLSSLYSTTLSHSLVEITAVAIGFTLFILTWNTRQFQTNNFLGILGIGYAFAAFIDLLHALSFKGLNVFPGFGMNLTVQLWIAARYLQAVTLCAAPLFVERRVGYRTIFGIYAAVTLLFVAMVYSGNFPVCYIEGKGLTTFKIGSEYLVTALLLTSMYLIYKKRIFINDTVLLLTLSSIACTVVSELSLTAFQTAFDVDVMVGHFFKLVAFYLIYRALLVTGLKEPFDIIFRDLKQSEETLIKSHDSLEGKIRERTAELYKSELQFRALTEFSPDCICRYDCDGRKTYVNPALAGVLGITAEQLVGKRPTEIDSSEQYSCYEAILMNVIATEVGAETELVFPDLGGNVHHHVKLVPEFDHAGEVSGVLVVGRDITALKRAEQALLDKQQHLYDITAEISLVEERERRRIAIELHDSIGQDLVLARIKLDMLAQAQLTDEQTGTLDKTQEILGGVIQHVRFLTHMINPPILESSGLEAALKWLARQMETEYGLRVAFSDDESDKPLTEEFRSVLYHAVRELLINVAKHAGTDISLVTVSREEGRIIITVEDDGIGFDPGVMGENFTSKGCGFGLFNIQRRIIHLGGVFAVSSVSGTGTCVTIELPLKENQTETEGKTV